MLPVATMIVLALDTTTRAGSLALTRDGLLLDTFVGDGTRTHATRLPGDLVGCLGRHGLGLDDVDLYAVAAGPGSFTGLRIGIATMQGLAFAHHRPLVAVSALDALVYGVLGGEQGSAAGGRPEVIGAWMDAQRHEVYAELYRPAEGPAPGGGDTVEGERGALEIVAAAAVADPALVASEWKELLSTRTPALQLVAVGDGALLYRSVLEAALPGVRVIEPVPPLAPAIAALASRRFERGVGTAPHAVKPVYVRRPDAELARDRRAQAQPPLPAAPRSPHE
jgi:tRNA threonylcarbamoyladenosine biosynthesis protein TsaB